MLDSTKKTFYPIGVSTPFSESFHFFFDDELSVFSLGSPHSGPGYPFLPLSSFPNLFHFPPELQKQCHEYLTGEWGRFYDEEELDRAFASWGLTVAGPWGEWILYLKCCLVLLRILRSDRPFAPSGAPRPSLRALYSYLFCLNVFCPLASPLSTVFIRANSSKYGFSVLFPLLFVPPSFLVDFSAPAFFPSFAMVEAFFPGLLREWDNSGQPARSFSMGDLLRLSHFHLFWTRFTAYPSLKTMPFSTTRFTRFILGCRDLDSNRGSLAFIPSLHFFLSGDSLALVQSFSSSPISELENGQGDLVVACFSALRLSRYSYSSSYVAGEVATFFSFGCPAVSLSFSSSVLNLRTKGFTIHPSYELLPTTAMTTPLSVFSHFYYCSYWDLFFSLKSSLRVSYF